MDTVTSRYVLQSELQSATKNERFCNCQRIPAGQGVSPGIVRHADGGHFVGFQTCGSIWICPVCSGQKRLERSLTLNAQIAGARAAGHEVLLVTFTVQHNAGDSLSAVSKALTKAFSATKQGRRGQAISSDFGVKHTVRAIEFKYGLNGWHPHLHVLFIMEDHLTAMQRVEMRSRLSDVYIDSLNRQGFSAAKGVGVDLRLAMKADYLMDAKEDAVAADSAGFEVASANTKMPKHSKLGTFEEALASGYHFHPFEIGRYAAAGSVKAQKLWNEYCVSTKGARALVYSQGADLYLTKIAIYEEIDEADDVAKPEVTIHPEPWLLDAIKRRVPGLREFLLYYPLSTYEDEAIASRELHDAASKYILDNSGYTFSFSEAGLLAIS